LIAFLVLKWLAHETSMSQEFPSTVSVPAIVLAKIAQGSGGIQKCENTFHLARAERMLGGILRFFQDDTSLPRIQQVPRSFELAGAMQSRFSNSPMNAKY
jgi:hypothetical protein